MGTSITNNSVTSIIENLFGTLIKLGLSNIDLDKLLELRFMKRLKILNVDTGVTLDELETLKQRLFHLRINEDGPVAMKLRLPYPVGDFNIATPTPYDTSSKIGFWEIQAQQVQMFNKSYAAKINPQI